MKKLLTLVAMLAMVTFNSCTTDDDTTGADGVTLRTLTFEGDSWSSLIDSDQESGTLLYGSAYEWTDSDNTELHNEFSDYGWGYAFYNGGVALSNYYCAVAAGVSYDKQLSIPVVDNSGNSGNDGSENFAVVFAPTTLSFSDGEARVIDHIYVTNTSYALTTATIGDNYGGPLVGDEKFWVSVTGYDADGDSVGELTFTLATSSSYVSEWTKWDLSSLGAVGSIYISIDSDNKSNGYSNIPSYVAIDDITVQF